MKLNTSDALKAKIIWWLGLVTAAVALYLRVFILGRPAWALWIMAYLFGSYYAYCCGVEWGLGALRGSPQTPDEKTCGEADEAARASVELLRAERDKLAELAVEMWGDDWPSKLDEWMKSESDKRTPSGSGRCHCPERECPCPHRFCPCIASYLDPGVLMWDDADCPCLNRAKNYKGDYDPWRAGRVLWGTP